MSFLTEYDEAEAMEMLKRDAKEEGREEGREEGLLIATFGFYNDGFITAEQAAGKLGMKPEEFIREAERFKQADTQ